MRASTSPEDMSNWFTLMPVALLKASKMSCLAL
jgi:hypothetical protein